MPNYGKQIVWKTSRSIRTFLSSNKTVEHTKMPNEENAFLFQKNTEHTQWNKNRSKSHYLFETNGDFFGSSWIAIVNVHGWHLAFFIGVNGAHELNISQRNPKHLLLHQTETTTKQLIWCIIHLLVSISREICGLTQDKLCFRLDLRLI